MYLFKKQRVYKCSVVYTARHTTHLSKAIVKMQQQIGSDYIMVEHQKNLPFMPATNQQQFYHLQNSVMPAQCHYGHNPVIMPAQSHYGHNPVIMPIQFHAIQNHHFMALHSQSATQHVPLHQFYGAHIMMAMQQCYIPLVQQQYPAGIPQHFSHANGDINVGALYSTPWAHQLAPPCVVKRQGKPITIQDPRDGNRDITLDELRRGRHSFSVALPVTDEGIQDKAHQVSKPEPEPVSTPDTEPVSTPDAEPVSTPDAEPVSTPDAEPVSTPNAEPVSTPDAEPVSTPDAEPVSTPDAEPVSTPDAEPVSTPDAEPVSTPDAEPVSTPDAEPVSTPDAEPVSTPDAEPVSTPDAEPVSTPDAEPVSTPDIESVSTPDTEPVSTPDAEPVSTPDAEPVSTPNAEPVSTPDAEPVSTPDAEPVSTPDAEPVSTPDAEPVSTPDAEPVSTPDAEPVSTPDAEPVSTPDIESVSTPDTEPVSTPDTEPVSTPDTEPVSTPDTESVSTPDAEPVSTPDAEPEPEPVSKPELQLMSETESQLPREPEPQLTCELSAHDPEGNKKEEQREEVLEQNSQVAPASSPIPKKPSWADILMGKRHTENFPKIRERETPTVKADLQKKQEKQQLSNSTKKCQLSNGTKNVVENSTDKNKKEGLSEEVVEKNNQVSPSTILSPQRTTWADILKGKRHTENVQKIREQETKIETADVQEKQEKQEVSKNTKKFQLGTGAKNVTENGTDENKEEERSEEVVEQNNHGAPSTLATPMWAEILKGEKRMEKKPEEQKKPIKQLLSVNKKKPFLSKKVELYIWNLDYSVDSKLLYNEFLPFGNIIHAKVMMEDGRSRGFGFVSFSSPAEAEAAIKKMNGKMLGKRPLNVSLSKAREARKPYRTQGKQMTGSSRPTKPQEDKETRNHIKKHT